MSVVLVCVAGWSGRAVLTASQNAAPAAPASASAVTFTDEQATRGEQLFVRVCVECHGRKEMTNADFRLKWNTRTAFDLFDRMRLSMPESDPGSLPRSQYLDVTAFIAKINGIAPGSVELPDDEAALRRQVLVLPPG
ncbi:MAG: cytochrome c [Gemmatimonadetes bacterium]|nr:cytochrome c [Gemmatimonadota bacterium]